MLCVTAELLWLFTTFVLSETSGVTSLHTGNRLANLHIHSPEGVWPCIVELLQQGSVLCCAVAWVHTVCLGTTAINWSATKQVAETGDFRDYILCKNESRLVKWYYRRGEGWNMIVCLPFSPELGQVSPSPRVPLCFPARRWPTLKLSGNRSKIKTSMLLKANMSFFVLTQDMKMPTWFLNFQTPWRSL